MKLAAIVMVIAGIPAILAAPLRVSAEVERVRGCLSAAETREAIRAHKLIEPFRAMGDASGRAQSEAIAVRLCRSNEKFVYDITMLRRDGRVVHVYVDAVGGAVVGSRNERSREPESAGKREGDASKRESEPAEYK